MSTQPQTLQEAIVYFADRDNALNYVVKLRWPNGVTCPRCGSKDAYFLQTRRIWKCAECRKQFSVKFEKFEELAKKVINTPVKSLPKPKRKIRRKRKKKRVG